MLTSVTVGRFKCLHHVEVKLGAFNVLIGPNDSGKTSFLEALAEPMRINRQGEAQFSDLAARGNPSPILEMESGTNRLTVETRGPSPLCNMSIRSNDNIVAQSGTALFLSLVDWLARVDHGAEFLTSEVARVDPYEVAAPSPVGYGVSPTFFATRWRGTTAHLARCALSDRPRFKAIEDDLRNATRGRVSEIVIGEVAEKAYPLSFRLHDGRTIPAKDLSQGLLVYLFFLCAVHRDDAPPVLLIEEPENGLHPFRLHEVVALLRELTNRGTQIVLTTHSPDLLSACEPSEVIVFLRPEPASGTEVHRLPKDFDQKAYRETLGQIWASKGEYGLLDMLPPVRPRIVVDGDP